MIFGQQAFADKNTFAGPIFSDKTEYWNEICPGPEDTYGLIAKPSDTYTDLPVATDAWIDASINVEDEYFEIDESDVWTDLPPDDADIKRC